MAENLQGTLILSILRGNKLINKDSGAQGLSDPYVRFTAKAAGKEIAAFRTKTIDNSLDPIWNERFSVFADNVPSVDFELHVFDEDPVGEHDSMGIFSISVNSSFKFDKDVSYELKPAKKKEKVTGTVTVTISYRKGQNINMNEQAKKRETSKKNFMELPGEAKNNVKEWRAKKDVFTECEEAKMAILISIFKNNFNCETPVFGIEKKNIMMYNYQKSTWVVGADDLTPIKWLQRMKSSDGDFINEAKDIIEGICNFQQSKKSSYRDGYMNDPEGLFCEELKDWASKQLSIMSMDTGRPLIAQRVGYLEECLLVTDLFDRPSSIAKETIQQVIIKVRRILKYRAIANIDKENAHQNATKDFANIKRHLSGLIRTGVTFLHHAFRKDSVDGSLTNADRLLLTLKNDENLIKVIGDELQAETDRIRGVSGSSEDAEWQTIDLREDGLRRSMDFLDPANRNQNDPILKRIFKDDSSGVDEWFRANPYIAYHFLRAHGLLLEAGRLFVVLEKASNAAKTGGTLLVYGLANAQLNATLDSTKAIMDELKEELNTVAKIAECCFEELVFRNEATKERSEWMKHFKNVFPNIREVNDAVKQIQKDVSKIKQVANSMSLLERFQQAADENQDFLKTADSFSSRMAAVTGKPYEKPKPRELTPEDNKALMSLIKAQ